jgi:hypothetical protein
LHTLTPARLPLRPCPSQQGRHRQGAGVSTAAELMRSKCLASCHPTSGWSGWGAAAASRSLPLRPLRPLFRSYEGPRDEAGIVKYLKKQALPAYSQLTSAEEVAAAKNDAGAAAGHPSFCTAFGLTCESPPPESTRGECAAHGLGSPAFCGLCMPGRASQLPARASAESLPLSPPHITPPPTHLRRRPGAGVPGLQRWPPLPGLCPGGGPAAQRH